jgi:hypothetical protein
LAYESSLSNPFEAVGAGCSTYRAVEAQSRPDPLNLLPHINFSSCKIQFFVLYGIILILATRIGRIATASIGRDRHTRLGIKHWPWIKYGFVLSRTRGNGTPSSTTFLHPLMANVPQQMLKAIMDALWAEFTPGS